MLDQNDVFARAGQVFGVLAASVGALYVIGGEILLIRLWVLGFEPPLDLVTRLPREVLISTGLLGIAVPVIVVSILYLAIAPRTGSRIVVWIGLRWPRRALGALLWGGVVFGFGLWWGRHNNLSGGSTKGLRSVLGF